MKEILGGEIQLKINLQPQQLYCKNIVENTPYTWIAYGGSRGGAKSHFIRSLALITAAKHQGSNQLIFRRLSNDLLENHINPLFAEHPQLRKYFNKNEMMLHLGKSMIKFSYAQYEDDIYAFQGKEYCRIYIDEATHFTSKMIEFLKTCNRSRIGITPKMILTTNPGGVSHSYIKRLFIDKVYIGNENPDDYIYVPARVHDNVIWVEKALKRDGYTIHDYYHKWDDKQRFEYCLKNSDYAKGLLSLPDEMRQAHLYGDWEIFGGMFFKGFDPKKQIIKPFEIPEQWTLIGSIDVGFSSPCSFGLMARDPNGKVYRIATYYESNRNPQDHAYHIKKFIEDCPYIRKAPQYYVAPPDAWAKRDKYAILSSDLTFADVFAYAGIHFQKAIADRIQGWWALKSLFPDKFFIFENLNKPLVTQLMETDSDPHKPEDIIGRGNKAEIEDHAIDECRYGVMSLIKPMRYNVINSENKTVSVSPIKMLKMQEALIQSPKTLIDF